MSNTINIAAAIVSDERARLITALGAFINQRSGIESSNYFSSWWDSDGIKAFRQKQRDIARHGKDARALLNAVASRDIPAADIAQALRDSFSGRLSWDGETLDYYTGQYFCTEYRAAACAFLSLALRRWWLADNQDVQKMARQWLGRGIASRWFN
jgi:hypothetical protein